MSYAELPLDKRVASLHVKVQLIQHVGSDEMIVRAARVSVGKDDEAATEAKQRGLIRYLLKQEHHSPLEHNSMTFLVEAPLFVLQQFARHRIGVSLSVLSGRYTEVDKPDFWFPDPDRPIRKVDGFTPARPKFEVDEDLSKQVGEIMFEASEYAWDYYQLLTYNMDVPAEVARAVLPQSLMTRWYATFNVRSLMHFLGLRLSGEKSYPQYEIEQIAKDMEQHLAELFPITYAAWKETNR